MFGSFWGKDRAMFVDPKSEQGSLFTNIQNASSLVESIMEVTWLKECWRKTLEADEQVQQHEKQQSLKLNRIELGVSTIGHNTVQTLQHFTRWRTNKENTPTWCSYNTPLTLLPNTNCIWAIFQSVFVYFFKLYLCIWIQKLNIRPYMLKLPVVNWKLT